MLVKIFIGLLVLNVLACATHARAEYRLVDSTRDYWQAETDLSSRMVPSSISDRGASHASSSNDDNLEILRSACVQWALTKLLRKAGIISDPQNPSVVRTDYNNSRGFGRPGGYQDYGFAFSETSVELNYAWRF